MTDYTKTTDFTSKDSLPSGDSGKIIRGAEFGTEFDNIETAVNSKSNIENPSFTGNITVTGTVDGRDIAADGTKLDTIETSADVTDTANVTAAGALMDSEVTNLAQVKAFDSADYATAAQGTTADNALPKTGGAMTGAITTNSTFDGRDVATDGTKLDGIEAGATADQTPAQIKTAYESNANTNAFTDADHTKLDGIEASADVTDTANVTAAGALMDSELTDIAAVKALNQGVATTDSPTFAGATVNGTVEFDGLSGTGAVTVTDILDQDNMSSNSATALATQQSIKSYVDSQVATSDTLAEVLANGNATGGTDVAFGANDKALFGAGSDLQIYHDGSNSRIHDTGTGNLILRGTNLSIQDSSGFDYITAVDNGDGGTVRLFYNNAEKLETTSTGIDVTGVITTDGMTTSADINFGDDDKALFGAGNDLKIYHASNNQSYIHEVGSGDLNILATNLKLQDAGGSTKVLVNSTGIDVTGNVTIPTGNKVAFDTDGQTYISEDIDERLRFWVANTEFMRMTNTTTDEIRLLPYGGNLFSGGNLDVTGTVSADGLTVDGSAAFNLGAGEEVSIYRSTDFAVLRLGASSTDHWSFQEAGTNSLYIGSTDSGTSVNRLRLDNNGDMALYEDTGTTAKLFWDAADESLGIGTSSPTIGYRLDILGRSGYDDIMRITGVGTNIGPRINLTPTGTGISRINATANSLQLQTGGTPAVTIDSSQNVGIGTDSPLSKLNVKGTQGNWRVDPDSVSGEIQVLATTAANDGFRNFRLRSNESIFETGGTERLRIDSSGTAMFKGGTTNNAIQIWESNSEIARIGGSSGTLNFLVGSTTESRMAIDSSGNVGIGTSSPNSIVDIRENATGGQARLRLFNTDQTNSTAQSALLFMSPDLRANGVEIEAVKENADFSAAAGRDIAITFSPVLNNTATERMRIDSNGNLLVGTTTTVGAGSAKLEILGGASGGRCINTKVTVDTSANHITFHNGNGQVGFINTTGTTTAYNTSSDERLKENIADADDAGSKIDAVQVRKYDWKADGSHQDYGMIAQELLEVAPEAVSVPEDPEDMLGVDYSKLVPMLVKEIQSLRARVAQLETN